MVVLNVYTPNRTSKWMRQKLIELQGRLDEPTILVGTLVLSVENGRVWQAENHVGHS